MSGLLDLLADDRNVIAYRPKLKTITFGALASILFQQVVHRAKNNHWKPFYKFTLPCDHPDCREGDSWCEELGFTESEFLTARDYIADKVEKGSSKIEIGKHSPLVYYWTDSNRRTWYEVNRNLADSLMEALYDDSKIANPRLADYLVNRQSRITKKGRKRGLHNTETSETTKNTEKSTSLFGGNGNGKEPKPETAYVPTEPYRILKEATASVALDGETQYEELPFGDMPESLDMSKKAKSPKGYNFKLAQAMATVCGMDFDANRGRLLKETSALMKSTNPIPTLELIEEKYGADGWWYRSDWRGLKGQKPTPSTLRQSWGQWQGKDGEGETFDDLLKRAWSGIDG